jgi:UDP-N-acetylmuramoyl-tripeptide--D-alanyl-D-alanine ligase
MIFDLIFIIFIITFAIRLLRNVFYILSLIQLKEYRFDRLLVHFQETTEGKRFLLNRKTFAFWLLFLLLPLYFSSTTQVPYVILATVVFLYDVKNIYHEYRSHAFKRPIPTTKIILIFCITVLVTLFYIFLLPFTLFPNLIIADRLIYFIIYAAFLAVAIPTYFVKENRIAKAKEKIKSMPKLLIIGVTGSYGKSSTKEIIAEMLSLQYNVLKTPKSVNTELGIANLVLNTLSPKHEVFVVEVGAYKKGEIQAVCNFVRPKIGVLTGVNEQHLALFGSLANTKHAKFELIKSLPEDGMAFFNGDDDNAKELSKLSKIPDTFLYRAKDLPIEKKSDPFLSNIAAAYLLGQKLKIDKKQLTEKVFDMIKTLGIKTSKKRDVTILDDSYNTNPKGFTVALDQLKELRGKKLLVTPGIIELGSTSERIHEELGERIGEICEYVVLTNDNFLKPIKDGLLRSEFKMENLLVPNRLELTATVKEILEKTDVVLFEGRMPKGLIENI